MANCFICKVHFSSYKSFFNHLKSHVISEFSYYTCLECNKKSFSSLDSFRKHMKNRHFNNEVDVESNISIFQNSSLNNVEYPLSRSNTQNIPQSSYSSSNSKNSQPSEHILDDILEKLKDSALKFVLTLFSKNNINRKDVFEIISAVKEFIVLEIVNSVKAAVLPFIDVKNKINLLDLLFNINNLFKETDSEYKLFNKLMSMDLITPIEEVTFSNEIQPSQSCGELCLTNVTKKGILLPIDFYIKKLFNTDNLIESALESIKNLLSKNTLENFVQGNMWRKKLELFPESQYVIPYFLYTDDLQINCALGSHTSSVCAIYISFPTLPNCHKIENILQAALIDSSDFKTFGNDVCLHDLINVLINLEVNGINFNINGEIVNVKFVLGLLLGDNLALNSLLECNKSFNANSYCRLCTTKKNEAENLCTEISENLRNRDNYDSDISKNDPQSTGLKRETILNEIPSFHFTDNQVVDMMHDLFEGVFIYDMCKAILLLIEKNKLSSLNDHQKFSLVTLNLRKKNFNYGPIEIGNVSPEISLQRLQSNNLNMSARECWTFVHFFPLMFYDLVDTADDVWQFICVVVRLLDLVLYVSHNSASINLLKNTIEEHNSMYLKLFDDTLKPKHHFLTHYPTIIQSSGPVRHFSSFMFEAKHKELKTYANVTNSRVCFILSGAIKYQMKFAYKIHFNINSCKTVIFSEKDKITSKYIETILSYEIFRNTDYTSFHSIYKGTNYKLGMFLAKFKSETSKELEAFEIKEILYDMTNLKIYLVCENKFILKFEENIVGYFVEKVSIPTIGIYPLNDFLGFPFNLVTLFNGKKAVRLNNFTILN